MKDLIDRYELLEARKTYVALWMIDDDVFVFTVVIKMKVFYGWKFPPFVLLHTFSNKSSEALNAAKVL